MSIKPLFSKDDAVRCAKHLYGLYVVNTKEFPGFEDRNYRLACTSCDGARSIEKFYLMKVSKNTSSRDCYNISNQGVILDYLSEEKFICPQILQSNDKKWIHVLEHHAGSSSKKQTYLVRVLTYIPGEQLMDHMNVVCDKGLLTEIGEFTAKLHVSLEKLTESKRCRIDVDTEDCWRMDNLSASRVLLEHIDDVKKRQVLSKILDQFESDVMTKYGEFSKGIIHGDITDNNLIVNVRDGKIIPLLGVSEANDLVGNVAKRKENKGVKASTDRDDRNMKNKDASENVKLKYGIIDFTDMTESCYMFEVAMVIKDMIVDTNNIDPVTVAGYVLGGYLQHRKCLEIEIDALYTCILAGLYQYVVLGHIQLKKQPQNLHARAGSEEAWIKIQELSDVTKHQALNTWKTLLQDEYNICI